MAYDPDARRDTPLALKLKDLIRREGPIDLSRYMSDCLWDDTYGYYATRRVIGAGGDFITAPEISQVFGELLGLWSAVVWQQMGAPSRVTLMEAGPGRGTLMRDALRAIDKVGAFKAALTVQLMEASPPLEALQRAALASCTVPMSWSHYGETAQAPLIVLANEFLDCVPVDQILKTPAGWRMRCVGLDHTGALAFVDDPRRREMDDLALAFGDAPIGAIAEIATAGEPLALDTRGAPIAALYIDYGHALSQCGDSLQAVRNHRHESIFTSPGEADLSAHVDFAAVAADATRAGLTVDGPVTQAEFLGSLGIMERASRLIAANPARANVVETGIARLMNPAGMGGRFKAIGVRSPGLPPLPGFPVPSTDR